MEYFFLITGILLFGEALALYIGVFVVKKGNLPWNTKSNRLFLITDSLFGLIIGLNWFSIEGVLYQILLGVVAILGIISHFKRTFENISKMENAFCGNQALFVVNNLKLVLLFGLLFTVLPF